MTLTKCDSCRYSSEQNGEHCYECVKGMNNNFEPFKDCRNCKKWDDCPCGKKGHENGTSQGYSIGECKDYELCEDYIRREDAINALKKALYDYEDKTEKQFKESKELNLEDWFQHRIFVQNMNDIDIQTILELPSVAPSYNSVKTELKPCEDCISRKDLIKKYANSFVSAYGVEVAEMFVSVVNQMPSVQPQPKKGKWIEKEYMDTGLSEIWCSNCKDSNFYNQTDNPFIPTNYCPNCGADMRGDSE